MNGPNTMSGDIGRSFTSDSIWLFVSATGRRHGVTHYPAIILASLDFGTVIVTAKHGNQKFDIKIYPRLAHVMSHSTAGSMVKNQGPCMEFGLRLPVV